MPLLMMAGPAPVQTGSLAPRNGGIRNKRLRVATASLTTTHSVPLVAQFSRTVTHKVPLTAQLSSSGATSITHVVPLTAQLSKTVTHVVPLVAALGATKRHTVPLTAQLVVMTQGVLVGKVSRIMDPPFAFATRIPFQEV